MDASKQANERTTESNHPSCCRTRSPLLWVCWCTDRSGCLFWLSVRPLCVMAMVPHFEGTTLRLWPPSSCYRHPPPRCCRLGACFQSGTGSGCSIGVRVCLCDLCMRGVGSQCVDAKYACINLPDLCASARPSVYIVWSVFRYLYPPVCSLCLICEREKCRTGRGVVAFASTIARSFVRSFIRSFVCSVPLQPHSFVRSSVRSGARRLCHRSVHPSTPQYRRQHHTYVQSRVREGACVWNWHCCRHRHRHQRHRLLLALRSNAETQCSARNPMQSSIPPLCHPPICAEPCVDA